MPTYQYACTECGNQLEAVQSFTDEPLTECPVCQGRLRKLFSSVGVVFKGSGFYRTDSRGGSTSAESSKPASTGSETKSAESKPAESKPAAASTSSTTTSSSSSASTAS